MKAQENSRQSEERQSPRGNDRDQAENVSNSNDAVEDDGSPVLDEMDLEENDLTAEEADSIEWEEPK